MSPQNNDVEVLTFGLKHDLLYRISPLYHDGINDEPAGVVLSGNFCTKIGETRLDRTECLFIVAFLDFLPLFFAEIVGQIIGITGADLQYMEDG